MSPVVKCRLCNREAVLQQSHIVPEFFYSPIYDQRHRLFQRVGGRLAKLPPLQKGLRERLLCRQCEQKLSPHEKYVREMLFGGARTACTNYRDRIELAELSYLSVRLCFLSVLWRMGIASHQAWRGVRLGPHEDRLRSMIHAEDPGSPTEYGFFCVIPLFDGEHLPDFLLGPDQVRFEGGRFYRAILGGLVVMFFVSKTPMPAKCQEFAITLDGQWVIPKIDAAKVGFIVDEAKRVATARRDETGR